MFFRRKVSSHQRFQTSDQVIMIEQTGTKVLMDMKGNHYFTMNPVAGLIWESLVEGDSMDGLIRRVHESFDADADQLTGDVRDFVGSLLSAKLIRRVH